VDADDQLWGWEVHGKEQREEREKDPPLPTFIICSTLAYNCTFAANLHHIPLPGEAVRRSANSR
jgi:hypothetical protein